MTPSLGGRAEPAGTPPWIKLLLLVGFLSVAAGVLAVRSTPSSGYEVSILGATPIAFWVAVVGAATIGALAVLFDGRLGTYAGVGLAGFATAAFVGLPFFHSYYFYGSNDALTHLGWAKDMLGPTFGFFDILYPGGHTLALFLSQTMGSSVRWGMMYAMFTAAMVTLVFVPLVIWVVARDARAVVIGAFVAMLMMPVNNVSTYPHFHSFTLTTMYFPFVLYLTFKHLTRSAEDTALPSWMSAASLALPIAIAATVFYHPQVAVNVLILMGTILGVGVAMRRRSRVSHPTVADGGQQHRLLAGQVVFFAGLLLTWALQYKHTYIYMGNIVDSAQTFLATGSGIGQVAAERGGSASSIGVSIVELFVKLFAVDAAFVALAAGLVVATVFGVLGSRNRDRDMTTIYIGCSALTLGPYFVATYVGGVSTYFFRHLGFSMVLAGVLGALALYHASDAVEGVFAGKRRTIVAVLVVAALCLSLAAYFPSPYMYNPNAQAPEQSFVGFGATFDHRAEGAAVASVRSEAERFSDALNADLNNDEKWKFMGEGGKTELTNATSFRPDESPQPFYYLTLSKSDYDREVTAYDQIRYGPEDFEYISQGTNPRISLVQTNGEFKTYHVDQRGLPVGESESEA